MNLITTCIPHCAGHPKTSCINLVSQADLHPYGGVEWLESSLDGWLMQPLEALRSFRTPTARP